MGTSSYVLVGTDKAMKETFALPNFPKSIAACVHCLANTSTSVESIVAIVSDFFANLELKTFKHLRISISFAKSDPIQELGNLDTKFFLNIVDDTSHASLLLDSQFKKKSTYFTPMIETLARQLLRLIRLRVKPPNSINGEVYKKLFSVFCKLLCVQSSSDIREILDFCEISTSGEEMDEAIFEPGKEVPECWHHRLDQTVENVFQALTK